MQVLPTELMLIFIEIEIYLFYSRKSTLHNQNYHKFNNESPERCLKHTENVHRTHLRRLWAIFGNIAVGDSETFLLGLDSTEKHFVASRAQRTRLISEKEAQIETY